MAIYTRDQIQYANMIQNALQNRARDIERKYDAFAKRGEMYGNTARNIGNIINDAFTKYGNYADTQEAEQAQRDFQASEAVKRAQEQRAAQEAQRAWQEEQNRLSRESTEKISALNRTAQNDYRMDEWTKGYNVANARVAELTALLSKNPNDETLKYQMAQAKAELNFYGSKLGIQKPEVTNVQSPAQTGAQPPAPAESYNNAELVKNVDTIFNGKWTNENRDKARSLISMIQDQAIRQQYEEKLAQKGETIEDQKYKWQQDVANWDGTGKEPSGTRSKVKGNKIQLIDIKTGNVLKEI